ncbi:MAG TPA: adenylate/guanylate cyclase domain-containing protein, partial [Myxococcaceae bacterium]|nr:adenylate/guanylate cyclase domain-containing protein [Myxococcaceae bacterium]
VLLATVMSVGAVLFALGLSVFLANRMSEPLAQVADEMAKVGDFRLGARAVPHTWFREIDVLNRTLEAMKGSLRSFANYVPRKLVRSLVASGTEASLGGGVKTLTVFFSDIANFTSFAESMKPDELVQRLGAYFEEMTGSIEGNGGTVDKFIGDGIMAFWGAPEEMADAPAQAAIAALRCQQELARLKASVEHPWMSQWSTRIGLATGEVLVGNIGTPERMNYTVMGDTANLASRLEGLNKAYGTLCLVDEATARAAASRVLARPVDVVAVKGKARGVKVYELLAVHDEARAPLPELARRSGAALDAYLKRDFATAAEHWRAVLALRPTDQAAKVMLTRNDELARVPPPPEWNGVHQAREK